MHKTVQLQVSDRQPPFAQKRVYFSLTIQAESNLILQIAKKRKEGKTKAQIWLDSDDRQNISIIKKEVGLTTQSQAISHALSVTVALGYLAQESVQSDQIDAQDHVQHIDK